MKSDRITGIRSVDFKIIAKGHGVVNWNGPTNLQGEDGKTVDNHTMPKLRGYSNLLTFSIRKSKNSDIVK